MSRLTALIGHSGPLPASLTDPENHGMREFCQPAAKEGETILLQEPGRVIREFRGRNASFGSGTCYRAYCYALIRAESGRLYVRCRNGLGESDVKVGHHFDAIVMPLDSDARFLLMHEAYSVASEAKTRTEGLVASRYQRAFLQGRLKKVKSRSQKGGYKAEIQPLDTSRIGVSVSLYGVMAGDVRRETYKLTASGKATLSAIDETPSFKLGEARNANIEVIYADGKQNWILGADRLDLEVWRSARELGLLDALATVLIREIDSDGHTGEAFRNPILALDALKAKVAA